MQAVNRLSREIVYLSRKKRPSLWRVAIKTFIDEGKKEERLAGVVGFEPTMRGTKNRCLTTWLHPKRSGPISKPDAECNRLLGSLEISL